MGQPTAERLMPPQSTEPSHDRLIYLKQLALYEFARSNCASRRVLDLGCGEGYGSAEIAHAARLVIGADRSLETMLQASAKYRTGSLVFVVCDAQDLPFASNSFDTVISFEVIEHVSNVGGYLAEVARVTRSAGVCLFSTPNRLLRLLPFQKPWNTFHQREYDPKGLARVLERAFGNVRVLGLLAKPDLLEIEKRRVRQNPFVAYPRMIARWVLPDRMYDLLKKRRPHASSKTESGLESVDASPEDYVVHPVSPDAITLLGLCERR